jgi:hypothetical protein
VTAEERSKMADHAQELAEQARELMQHGRLRDADPFVQQALDADPLCVPRRSTCAASRCTSRTRSPTPARCSKR